jgi:hypothetical protein
MKETVARPNNNNDCSGERNQFLQLQPNACSFWNATQLSFPAMWRLPNEQNRYFLTSFLENRCRPKDLDELPPGFSCPPSKSAGSMQYLSSG